MTDTTTKIDGASLVPNFDEHEGLAVTNDYTYHLGLVEGCPVNQIFCGGLDFQMITETIRDNKLRPGKKQRVQEVGGLNKHVTSRHIAKMREQLPRLVIRFKQARQEEPGTGKNIGDPHTKRNGTIITIPTKKQVAAAEKAGHRIPTYTRQPGDVPATRFMYFHLCTDQKNPQRGTEFSTIEESGIVWPDELSPEAEAEAVLKEILS